MKKCSILNPIASLSDRNFFDALVAPLYPQELEKLAAKVEQI